MKMIIFNNLFTITKYSVSSLSLYDANLRTADATSKNRKSKRFPSLRKIKGF